MREPHGPRRPRRPRVPCLVRRGPHLAAGVRILFGDQVRPPRRSSWRVPRAQGAPRVPLGVLPRLDPHAGLPGRARRPTARDGPHRNDLLGGVRAGERRRGGAARDPVGRPRVLQRTAAAARPRRADRFSPPRSLDSPRRRARQSPLGRLLGRHGAHLPRCGRTTTCRWRSWSGGGVCFGGYYYWCDAVVRDRRPTRRDPALARRGPRLVLWDVVDAPEKTGLRSREASAAAMMCAAGPASYLSWGLLVYTLPRRVSRVSRSPHCSLVTLADANDSGAHRHLLGGPSGSAPGSGVPKTYQSATPAP
mmetsp:Transcript_19266/g.76706  ORF Transcript_19266/g.76706 Transcript_19266/m.76706 type:complete len:306 (+) Transcript_19266:195-1112(+)